MSTEIRRCPHCGREAEAHWIFCVRCGKELTAAPKKAPAAPGWSLGQKRSGLAMTINDVAELFRSYGIPIEPRRLADSIAAGDYPFGRVVRVSAGGRRTFEIWRVDVEAFLKSKIPKGENV